MYIAVAFVSPKNDKMIVVCHRDTKEEAEERFREVLKKNKRKFVCGYTYKIGKVSAINAQYLTNAEVLKK